MNMTVADKMIVRMLLQKLEFSKVIGKKGIRQFSIRFKNSFQYISTGQTISHIRSFTGVSIVGTDLAGELKMVRWL
jgi:hypothetical protein